MKNFCSKGQCSKIKALRSSYEYNPDVVKCDIEGAEVHFADITADDMKSVSQFAVEYHDNDLKLLMEKKIKDWGFKNTDIHQLFDEDINRIGVIYAWK